MDARTGALREENMKKRLITLLITLMLGNLYAQQIRDKDIKNQLINEGFGNFTFFENDVYKYHYKEMSESLDFSGKYKIESGLIIFESLNSIKINGYESNGESLDLGIPGKYKIDNEKKNKDYQGALVGIDNDKIYWSNKPISANEHTVIDGVECILYPQNEDNKKYVLLLENLKIRKQPSTKAEVLTINGYESEAGCIFEKRNVEFAGSVLWVKAKSVKEDTIDEKTSPWYYIMCSDEINNFDGMRYFGWIYGGYVKEIEQNKVEEYKNEYKPLLIKKLKEAGAELN